MRIRWGILRTVVVGRLSLDFLHPLNVASGRRDPLLRTPPTPRLEEAAAVAESR